MAGRNVRPSPVSSGSLLSANSREGERGTMRVALAQTDCALVDLGNIRRRRREVPLLKEARLALLARELNRLAEEGGDL
jgi:hypothetical protein